MAYIMITGASSGIGEALAQQLAAQGKDLILIARSEQTLQQLVSKLAVANRVDLRIIVADLANREAPQAVFAQLQAWQVDVDSLFNVAGVGASGEFSVIDVQQQLAMIDLNIHALLHLSHLFINQRKGKGSGTLVNISSMTAFMPVPFLAAYAASKVFVRSFTESLTQECKPYGIQVLLACPGLTRTNFNAVAGLSGAKAAALQADYVRSASQTAEEVATEILTALRKNKSFVVTGRRNRWGMRLLALLPNRLVARFIANSYRKTSKKK